MLEKMMLLFERLVVAFETIAGGWVDHTKVVNGSVEKIVGDAIDRVEETEKYNVEILKTEPTHLNPDSVGLAHTAPGSTATEVKLPPATVTPHCQADIPQDRDACHAEIKLLISQEWIDAKDYKPRCGIPNLQKLIMQGWDNRNTTLKKQTSPDMVVIAETVGPPITEQLFPIPKPVVQSPIAAEGNAVLEAQKSLTQASVAAANALLEPPAGATPMVEEKKLTQSDLLDAFQPFFTLHNHDVAQAKSQDILLKIGGVENLTALKEENYRAVYDAIQADLAKMDAAKA